MGKGINDTTRDRIRAALVEGMESGEGYKSLAARVRLVFGEASTRRSEAIARTEVIRSSNFGKARRENRGDGKACSVGPIKSQR